VSKHSLTQKFTLTFHTLTKMLSKVVLHVVKKSTTYLVSYQQLNKRSTEDVLNWSPSCFVTVARRLFHCKIALYIGWSSTSFHFCRIAFSSSCNLHTVHVALHTQVLARCRKLNNLKGSSLVLWFPYFSTDEIRNNVSKKILSCLGSMWWRTVLHELEVIG